jgi:hypothetical protein
MIAGSEQVALREPAVCGRDRSAGPWLRWSRASRAAAGALLYISRK